MSIRLYVGNLPKEVDRKELEAVFAGTGDLTSTKVIVDRKTGKCRGFAFVTVPTDELADQIIEQFNGSTFKDTVLKIEKAMPRKGKGDDEAPESVEATPAKAARRSGGGGGGGKKGNGGGRRAPGGAVVAESSAASAQPDPRWAGELAKLKQLLNAQTTGS
ncbi:RNA recognition motif domain-containing protein [Limnothrix redekei]|uniref:RNA-binding protein n=1 Tax=Limnothrix redekei LRLZ20PSL1 TaxID=3112953 RepID=A0ABW7CA25_9CYAN